MTNSNSIAVTRGLCLCLLTAVAPINQSCNKSAEVNPSNTASGGTSSVGSGGAPVATGGSSSAGHAATAGATATAGSSAGQSAGTSGASAGTGTSGASAGTNATAGTGGAAGSQAASGSGASGAGGSAGSSAGAGGSEDPSVATCLAGITAAGRTVGDCEHCLCQVGNCQDQLTALSGDTKGNTLVTCAQTHTCWDQCCICGTSSAGAMCMTGYSDFGKGPCANEVQDAAGLTPMTDIGGALANGAMVTSQCDPEGTAASNSCNRATKLAKCASSMCAAMCPQVKTSCP